MAHVATAAGNGPRSRTVVPAIVGLMFIAACGRSGATATEAKEGGADAGSGGGGTGGADASSDAAGMGDSAGGGGGTGGRAGDCPSTMPIQAAACSPGGPSCTWGEHPQKDC